MPCDWQTSVHAANGISCHDCHGGDPTDMAMAKSPDRGFLGAPEYEEVPEFCGRCHVGVFEAYSAGAHGQALAEGGAQCVICHGNHAIQEAGLELTSRPLKKEIFRRLRSWLRELKSEPAVAG